MALSFSAIRSGQRRIARIGADVGGTFTDVILMDGHGHIRVHKLPSTPPDFEQAVLQAIAHLLREAGLAGSDLGEVAHGTTVATNAVLEHRGAVTALVTTRGFRDVLELRRIRAPQMYDLFFQKPRVLVERHLRLEVGERVSAAGDVLQPVEEAELQALLAKLEEKRVESVAVCFLHAYAYPEHERKVGDFLRARMPQIPVSLSSEVLRERREYERTATTVVNAYIRPVMERYLGAMRRGLGIMGIDAPLLLLQSAGGLTPEREAACRPVVVLESGPAAGVLAAEFAARKLGLGNLITLDIGGTTAKACLIESGRIPYTSEYEVGSSLSASNRLVGGGGERIRAPSIDLAEIGSGGGSVAYRDRAGGLHVGPRSAGAIPGPACYHRGGTEPTVTDANVVLGYIRPGKLADGQVEIDREAAERAIQDCIARPLNLSLMEAAEGIHRIADAVSLRALRAVSTERGRDPRDFALMAFGGTGPLHAAGLAEELGVRQTLVPPLPGLFSALGLLASGVEHHDVRSCLVSGPALTPEPIERVRTELLESVLSQFQSEGFSPDEVLLHWTVDARYRGQASELRIPLDAETLTLHSIRRVQTEFENEHERLYGHRSDPDNPMEVIAVRLVGRVPSPGWETAVPPAERLGDCETVRKVYFGPRWGLIETPVLHRKNLDGRVPGPLLIDEYDSTIVIPPGRSACRDDQGNVVISSGILFP